MGISTFTSKEFGIFCRVSKIGSDIIISRSPCYIALNSFEFYSATNAQKGAELPNERLLLLRWTRIRKSLGQFDNYMYEIYCLVACSFTQFPYHIYIDICLDICFIISNWSIPNFTKPLLRRFISWGLPHVFFFLSYFPQKNRFRHERVLTCWCGRSEYPTRLFCQRSIGQLWNLHWFNLGEY